MDRGSGRRSSRVGIHLGEGECRGRPSQTTFSFTKDAKTGFQDWRFPLRDADARTFRYRQTLLFTNAGRESGEWITVTDNRLKKQIELGPGQSYFARRR